MKRKNSFLTKRKKAKLDRESITVISLVGLIILATIAFNVWTNTSPATWVSADEVLPSNKVCMVNNTYLGVQQIEVPVDGKVYFGCCEMCVTTLNQKPESRYAFDPFSGEQIDKSTAFIYLNPDSKHGGVLYFKSVENFQAYSKLKN